MEPCEKSKLSSIKAAKTPKEIRRITCGTKHVSLVQNCDCRLVILTTTTHRPLASHVAAAVTFSPHQCTWPVTCTCTAAEFCLARVTKADVTRTAATSSVLVSVKWRKYRLRSECSDRTTDKLPEVRRYRRRADPRGVMQKVLNFQWI